MLTTASIIAFAATADPNTAVSFYRDRLGLRLVVDEPFTLVFDANGTMLRIQKVQQTQPVPYTTLGWRVTDIKESVTSLQQAGVHCEQFEGLGQDDNGIVTFPDGAKVAWFRDPEGNLLSLTQVS